MDHVTILEIFTNYLEYNLRLFIGERTYASAINGAQIPGNVVVRDPAVMLVLSIPRFKALHGQVYPGTCTR